MASFKAVANLAPVIFNVPLVLNSAAVDQDIFVADRAYRVESVSESHAVAGSNGGAVTLDVKKCASGVAAASGTTVLGSTFDMKSTADTPVTKTRANGGVVSTSVGYLAAGDRLVLDITGTTTDYAGGVVTVALAPTKGNV